MSFAQKMLPAFQEIFNPFPEKMSNLLLNNFTSAITNVLNTRMKSGEGKLDLGIGEFVKTRRVTEGSDNLNISFVPKKEFKEMILENDKSNKVDIDDEEFIEEYKNLLEAADLDANDTNLVYGIASTIVSAIKDACAEGVSEDQTFPLEVEGMGKFKIHYYDGKLEIEFDGDKALKQDVKDDSNKK
jgi:hypothetical protein